MTFTRNLKVLWNDVSFNRCIKMLAVVMLVALMLFVMLWFLGVGIDAKVYKDNAVSLLEYTFCILGAIDGNPETEPLYAVYSAFVRLSGAILIGGVITSFLCTLLNRYSDMTQRGLRYRKLSHHTVIVGYNMITSDFIRRVLKDREDFEYWYPDRPFLGKHRSPPGKVLLYTSDDVVKVRESLSNLLPKDVVRNIEFVLGEMDVSGNPERVCERLCLKDARRVFVLGDSADAGAGELRNLNFAVAMADYLRERLPEGLPLPIYVQMEDSCSFDLVKKMDYGFDAKKVMLLPFSFSEGWARAVWGDVDSPYEPLDFRPLRKDDYVRLVVGGLSDFGRALAIEAIRVAHYVNGGKTRITLVDPRPHLWSRFTAAYPGLPLLPDIDISYVEGTLESEAVRELLSQEAQNPCCLLTVAVCDDSPDKALETTLNMPREIYPDSDDSPSRAAVPRSLFRQDHGGPKGIGKGTDRFPACQKRYAYVQPFGWQELGVPTWCLQRFSVLSGLWFYKYKEVWEAQLGGKRIEDIDFDAMRKEAFGLYQEVKMSLAWANVYTADSITTVLRQRGFKAVRSVNEQDFRRDVHASLSVIKGLSGPVLRDFARAEHNRWMADRVLMGYLPHPGTPRKDDDYRWHNCLVDFGALSEAYVHNDESSVKSGIYTLAMMGYRVEANVRS